MAESRRKWDAEGMLLLTTLNERVHNLQRLLKENIETNTKRLNAMQDMQNGRKCSVNELRIGLIEGVVKVIGVAVVGLVGKTVYSILMA